MAYYLDVGIAGADVKSWRLHVEEDPKRLLARFREATRHGTAVEVEALAPDQLLPHTLALNPANLAWWRVLELPEEDDFPPGV